MLKRKKDKKALSYVTLHNAAVVRFQKSSRIFIWAAVVNFIGLIIGHIQYIGGNTLIPFSFCYGVSNFFFNLLWYGTSIPEIPIMIIAYIVSFLLSLVTAWMGVMASQAKKNFLIACAVFYLIDWVFVLLAYFIAYGPWSGLLFNGGIHVIISFFLIIAVYEYYNVIKIEKRFVKPTKKTIEPVNKEEVTTDGRS